MASREVGKQMITILGGWTLHGLKRHAMSLLVCFGSTVAFVQIPVFAQTSEPVTSAQTTAEPAPAASAEAQAQADTTVANEETKFTDDEIDQLISRIALYPDPLLELTLQAAIFPLQIVQASRFLEKHAKDPNLKPDLNWDSSVLGLLNYPVVVSAMNDDLDWTERLGQAVVNQLDDVQDSIQQFRSELYAGGVLVSNDKQRVIVSKDVIAILPANGETIYVPQYDAAAMQTAATGGEEATEAAAESATTETSTEETVATTEAGTETAATTAAPAPAANEYAAPATGTTAAPVYSSAPVYAAPPVAYSNPYPSFWSSAAIFLGGAAIGGLIGYGFGDDDDDNNNNNNDGGSNWSRDVNIEDSNIVINKDDDRIDARRGDVRRNDVQAELRNRQNRQTTQNVQQQRRAPQGRATAAPTRAAQANQPQRQAATATQNRQTNQQKQAAAKRRPGDTAAKPSNASALSGSKNVTGKQAKAESRRGAQSRATSAGKSPTSQLSAKRPPQQVLSRPSSGAQVQRQSQRGRQSAGGAVRRR